MKQPRRWLARILLLMLAAGLGSLSWFAHYVYTDLKPAQLPVQFDLKAGSSLKSAAQQMAEAGVLHKPVVFVVLARLLGEAGNIKAGNYEIDAPLSPLALLRKVTRGDFNLVAITFVEGWTFSQIRKVLNEHPALRHDTKDASDAEILRRLEIDQPSPEGWFFPDTYHLASGTSDLAVLRRAHRLMQLHLDRQWQARTAGLPLKSPYEALILASIVEKETGRPDERPLIAAVFINRLRIGMRLQTDPTVIYGMGERFDGNIRKSDLTMDTPYNTYTRDGLPPTPIAMPGLASLVAALNPAQSNFLYFVARGDGSSYFSRNLEEHNRAVTKYQRSGRRP
jgi:UPF0755 protein